MNGNGLGILEVQKTDERGENHDDEPREFHNGDGSTSVVCAALSGGDYTDYGITSSSHSV